MQKRLPKFRREPSQIATPAMTELDLDIVRAIHDYPFLATSALARVLSRNPKGIARNLQPLYHHNRVSRFSFARSGSSQFHYYLDQVATLQLLAARRGVSPEELDFESVRRNREKAYDGPEGTDQGHGLFLRHEVMVSSFHAMLEVACRDTDGAVELETWRQGPELWSTVEAADASGKIVKLPHRPDAFFTLRFPLEPEDRSRAHFFYEADRKTTNTTKFRRKLRAHWEFIVGQRKHQTKYGIHRIRAVLVETLDASWAQQLRNAARDGGVSGNQPSPLFWFTTSEFADPAMILKPVWASPVNDQLLSLAD